MKKTSLLFVSFATMMTLVGCSSSGVTSSSSISANSNAGATSSGTSSSVSSDSQSSNKEITKADLASALAELCSGATKFTVKKVEYTPDFDDATKYRASVVSNEIAVYTDGVVVKATNNSYNQSGEIGYEASATPDFSNANDYYYYGEDGKVVYTSVSEFMKSKTIFAADEVHSVSMAKSFYGDQIKAVGEAIGNPQSYFNSFIGTKISVGMGGSTVTVDSYENFKEDFVTNLDESHSYSASATFPKWGFNSLKKTVHATMEKDGTISSYGVVDEVKSEDGGVVSIKYTSYIDVTKGESSAISADALPNYSEGEWTINDKSEKFDLSSITSDGNVTEDEAKTLLRKGYTLTDGVTGVSFVQTSEKDSDYRIEKSVKLYQDNFVEEKGSQTAHKYTYDESWNKVDAGVKTASYSKQTKYADDMFTTKWKVNDPDETQFFIANDSIQKSYNDMDGVFSYLDNSFAGQLGYATNDGYNSYSFSYTEDSAITVDSVSYADGIISASYSVDNYGTITKYEMKVSANGIEEFVNYSYNWSLDGEEKIVATYSRAAVTAFAGEII